MDPMVALGGLLGLCSLADGARLWVERHERPGGV